MKRRLLQYLKGTVHSGITYNAGEHSACFYSDATWADNKIDRRSYTGVVGIVAGGAVIWHARKQQSVALSSVEAEYVALSAASREAIWLRRILLAMGSRSLGPLSAITTLCDSQGAQALAASETNDKSKHIELKHHFIRECVAQGTVAIEDVASAFNAADLLTKGKDVHSLERLSKLFGFR